MCNGRLCVIMVGLWFYFINRLVLFRLWALMCVFGLIQFEVCLLVKVGVLVLLGKDEI